MNEIDTKAKQQIVEKIKSSKNILIIVSKNPSVDDLSAAIGLTALLNKTGKHATAIFSGILPPAIAFLDPTKIFENTVNSLRDFIIALDKEKADHLRYKIDGDLVKIFITPYRTTITGEDLEFSQGDYNVELVLALGVANRENLDLALASDTQVLSDATVATFCAGSQTSDLGSISWRDENAGCLSEMIMSLSEALKTDKPLLDKQIATAFLTGIVASTDRFSNEKTTSKIMTMSAQLMAAGADQQLIAARLREAHEINFTTEIPKPEQKPEFAIPKEDTPTVIATPLVVAPIIVEPPVTEAPVIEPIVIEPPVVEAPVVIEEPVIPTEQAGTLNINHHEPIVLGPVASTLPPEDFQISQPAIETVFQPEDNTISTLPVIEAEPAIPMNFEVNPTEDTTVNVVPQPEQIEEVTLNEVIKPLSQAQPSSFINTLSNLAQNSAPVIPEVVKDDFSPSTIPDHDILPHSYLSGPAQSNVNGVNDNVFGLTPDDTNENVDIFASGLAPSVQINAPQIDLPMPPELPDFSSLPPSNIPGVVLPESLIPAPDTNAPSSDPGQFKIPS